MLLRKKLRFGFEFTSRYRGEGLGLDCSQQNLFRASFYLAHFSLFPFPLTERIYDAYFNLLYRVD